MAKRPLGSQVRDLLAYVAIGIACVGAVIALAVYGTKKGERQNPVVLNWLGLGGAMAIVYVTAIHDGRNSWASMRFWSGLAAAALVEIGLGTLVLWNAPRLSIWVWAGLYPINLVALEQFLRWWQGSSVGSRAPSGPRMR